MSATFIGGQDTRLTSLAFCARYNRDAHYANVKDSAGVARWVTQKQMRIYGIVSRVALSVDGKAKMKDIAKEASCAVTTVSRTILKLQAWGLFAIDVRRGRNGGITVHRPLGEWMRSYVRAARQKLREMADRARINVASRFQREKEEGNLADHQSVESPNNYLLTMDATFSPEYAYAESRKALKEQLRAGDEAFNVFLAKDKLGSFGLRVIEERRRLAIEDPEGESEAVRPVWGA